jgi:thioredoxin-dependent peroxiredoxin
MPSVEPGGKAPAFSLKDQDDKTHRLKDYAGRPVVLYFYPKDDTPGCTREACDFRDALPDFQKSKAAVLGVSILDTASKAKFARKHKVSFPLLADPDHEVAEKYGAWKKKSMYGKTFMGLARTTFLIGRDGTVVRRWDNVKVDGHAHAVLEAVEAL